MLIEETLPQHLSAEIAERRRWSGAPEPTNLLEYSAAARALYLDARPPLARLSDSPDLIVMRMIEDGQLIAQCNLRSLAARQGRVKPLAQPLPRGNPDGARLGRSADRRQPRIEQSNGIRQLRVSVVGQVANAPIHWIYYQLTDASRQLLTCVFTMSGQNVERFGAEDIAFVSSLTLNPPDATAPAEGQDVARRAANAPNDRSGKSGPHAARWPSWHRTSRLGCRRAANPVSRGPGRVTLQA